MNRFALLICLLLFSVTPALAVDNLVLDNQVVSLGQVVNETARVSITAGPAYEIQAGADVSLGSQNVTLQPGFRTLAGGKLRVYIGTFAEFNTAPVVVADTALVVEGGAVLGNVLTNDTDPDGDLLSVTLAANVSHGTLVLNADGSFSYTHDGSETTSDTFSYTASDGTAITTTTVTITITPVNDPPQAVADQVTVDEDSSANILDVLTNDFDVDPSDSFDITSITPTSNGGTAINNGVSISYTPLVNFAGIETLSYTITDQSGTTATALVSITVNDIPDPPVSLDDSYTLSEKSYNNILAVTVNDIDYDENDQLIITEITTPDHGGIARLFPGAEKIYYTPAGVYVGEETFTYTITDSHGMIDTATVTINLTDVADEPIASNDIYAVAEDSLNNQLTPLANDYYDPDAADGLTISAIGTPNQGGFAEIASDDASLIYTPADNFSGQEEFDYTITDSNGKSHSALVLITVNPANDAPQANADFFTVDDDSINTVFFVLENDVDIDNDQLTISTVTIPNQGGTVTIDASGSKLFYSPLANFSGEETFTYTITDAEAEISSALVTVTVENENYSPQAVPDQATTLKNEAVTIDVLANDSDLDNDPLTVETVSAANHGTVEINTDHTITYLPSTDYFGLDSFTYTLSDGLTTATGLVIVTIMPPPSQIATDLILENITLAPGEAPEYFATNSITAAPNYTIQTGGAATMTSKRIVLRPGFTVQQGASLTVKGLQVINGIVSDLILENVTVASGESHAYKSVVSISAAPAFEVQAGGNTSMTSGRITLRPGFIVRQGGTLSVTTSAITGDYAVVDNLPPTIISGWPADGDLVATQGGALTYLVTFADQGGVSPKTVLLYDQDGNDITGQASVTYNSIELVIDTPQSGDYTFKLLLGDSLDNILVDERSFTVDTILPVTTNSLNGGLYNDAVKVDLSCSEQATIYYSSDGYPPFVGASNTIAVIAPAEGILIRENTHLQFFAVDTAGNIEDPTKEAIYFIGAIPGEATVLTANYNLSDNQVEFTWPAVPFDASGYQLYRCNNTFDCAILDKSRTGGYAPPAKLQIASLPSTTLSHNDVDIIQGATYSYGISVTDDNGVEGVISELEQVVIPATSPTLDKSEAIARGTSWLEQNQSQDGFWGDKEGIRVLATSQALNALRLAGIDNAGIRQGIFWLRGRFADNNDYLSRQILTLADYNQNVDEPVNRLVSQAEISGITIVGWGTQRPYQIDALDTALGSQAISRSGRQLGLTNGVFDSLKDQPAILSNQEGKFAWVNGKDPSVYVSAFVYNILDSHFTSQAPINDQAWILSDQNADGSYGNGVVDTAAVLLWLGTDALAADNAISYLVSQQELNGSWLNDPYITGLCLQALEAK